MKPRAVALLLFVVACNGARQQTAVPELYRQTRIAIERGQFDEARKLARKGMNASAGDFGQLFAIADAEALSRRDKTAALALLNRIPESSNAEANVRKLMVRGYLFKEQGAYKDAEAIYAEADRLATASTPWLRAEIAMLRITPPFESEQLDVAERFAHQAIAMAKAQGPTYVLANAYGMLGSVEMKGRRWEPALQHLTTAARLSRQIGARSTLAITTGNIGWCNQQLGELDDAQARFFDAEKYAETENITRVQPTWLANIANTYVIREQFRDALPYAQRSVIAARKYKEVRRLATSLSNLAQVHLDLGDFGLAKSANDEALALYRKTSEENDELPALLNAARIDDANGDADRALKTLNRVVAISQKASPLRWQAQATAAEINWRLDRKRDAARMYDAALATGDSARPVTDASTYHFAFETNLIGFYDRYIELLLGEDRVVDALRVAERSRARMLRDGLNELKVDPRLDPRAIARAHDAVILWYWLGTKRSLLWIVTPEGIAVERLRPRSEIETMIEGYRSEMVARRSGIDNPRAAALFEMLVAPALRHTRRSRFVVVPDGRMNDLPLETVVVSSPEPHYWIEDATISYSPCLQHLAGSGKRRSLRDGQVLVVGNVPAQNGFAALVHAGAEMTNIAEHFQPHQRVVQLAGLNATRAAVLQSDLANASIIHFATHSIASVSTPLDSCVILAGAQRLTGHDIVHLNLHAELVTVSSCSSAGRRTYAGEGLVGLAWAFLRANAKRVIASQWDVSDSAAATVMDNLYVELASGHDPASALRTAKLELLHSNPAYEPPYYWAPFILYGAP